MAQTITTVAGGGICSSNYCGDGGPATSARLSTPKAVALDPAGNMYIADTYNNCIRKVDANGIITTFAGDTAQGFAGDGGPAASAKFNLPEGLVFDPAGNLYVADAGNHRIRKINTSGVISTIAGTGTAGFFGDGGPATSAKLNNPVGLCFDATGNLYVADKYNCKIRRINTSGLITTVAGGTVGFSGDGGPATSAGLNWTWGVSIDNVGNMYIADGSNHRVRIVNTSGVIHTFAGNGSIGYSGDGGLATSAGVFLPSSVAFDALGNVYIADVNDYVVRIVNSAGIINTFAGINQQGYSGDGGPANAAKLALPIGLAMDVNGNLFIADEAEYRIRKVSMANGIKNDQNIHLQLYPNPTNSILELKIPPDFKIAYVTNLLGENISSLCRWNMVTTEEVKKIDVSLLPPGVYFLTLASEGKYMTEKFIVQH
jgi:hypothetical protein